MRAGRIQCGDRACNPTEPVAPEESPDMSSERARPVMVVRVGAQERFNQLTRIFAAEGVEIIWDRRHGERRHRSAPAEVDRRRRDRRSSPSSSWSALDFVVVGSPPGLDGRLTSG
jgi:hypothetical protein